jgi:hypothetical protein
MTKTIISIVFLTLMLCACGAQSTTLTEPAVSPTQTETATATSPAATQTPQPTLPPTDAPTETPTEVPTDEPTATYANIPTFTPESETVTDGISFSADVLPLLQNRCARCHGEDRLEEGLNLTSYDGLVAGSVNGAVIVSGSASDSLLVQLVQEGKMPKRGARLTPEQVQIIIDWVNQGAPNN